jgi:proteasome assembly chaperone (PAC2) family protein
MLKNKSAVIGSREGRPLKKTVLASSRSHASKDIVKHINGWQVTYHKKVSFLNPILIEGMPGIGNVGKICMDVLIEEIGAELLMSFFSFNLPNAVFVNERNLVDLPHINLYHKQINNQDMLFLTGDVQPMDEHSCYTFCELVLEMLKVNGCKHLVTLGGIGLAEMPSSPKLFITGNDAQYVMKIIQDLKQHNIVVSKEIYGHVGPILGVSGVLLGMAKNHSIDSYCLLAETLGHPMYLGLKSARIILKAIVSKYSLDIKISRLEKEIRQIDERMAGGAPNTKTGRFIRHSEMDYIG